MGTSIPKVGELESGSVSLINSLVFDRPIATGPDGQILPKIFDKWDWRENGLALNVHVRPGVLFHDGTRLTAPMAAGILQKELIEDRAANLIISDVASVEAVDDSNFLVRTTRREGLLLTDIAAVDLTLPGNDRIGTGPFKLTDDPAVLARFDQYYQGRPAIEQARMQEYPTQRAAWSALMRGDIDMLHEVSREALDFVKLESTVQTRSFLRAYYDAIAFSMQHPVLARREVRQALNAAVDRQELVETVMRHQGTPASDPIWPSHWAYAKSQATDVHSTARAIELLEAAGLTAGKEQPEGRMPSRFHFRCLVLDGDPRFERSALVVQRQLAEVGVDMEVVPVAPKVMGKALASGQFEAAMMEFVGSRSLNWNYIFWHSPTTGSPPLDSGYTAADPALDRFRSAIDPDEVRAAVADMQRVFRDDPPALFLAWVERSRAVSRSFSVPDAAEGDVLGSLWRWRPAALQARAEPRAGQ